MACDNYVVWVEAIVSSSCLRKSQIPGQTVVSIRLKNGIGSLIPRPLPDFISQPWRKIGCEIKSGSGLGTRLLDRGEKLKTKCRGTRTSITFIAQSLDGEGLLTHVDKACIIGLDGWRKVDFRRSPRRDEAFTRRGSKHREILQN